MPFTARHIIKSSVATSCRCWQRVTRTACLALMLIATLPLSAQEDDMYKMEIGAGVGMVTYLGDFNENLTKNMQPAASILLRRVFNPYMDMRLNLMYGKLKGNSQNAGTYYPDYQNADYSFSNTLFDASLVYEYNFWPYGTGKDYRGQSASHHSSFSA